MVSGIVVLTSKKFFVHLPMAKYTFCIEDPDFFVGCVLCHVGMALNSGIVFRQNVRVWGNGEYSVINYGIGLKGTVLASAKSRVGTSRLKEV